MVLISTRAHQGRLWAARGRPTSLRATSASHIDPGGVHVVIVYQCLGIATPGVDVDACPIAVLLIPPLCAGAVRDEVPRTGVARARPAGRQPQGATAMSKGTRGADMATTL